MHLDPGVNRLGLNITSVHQTDRRPVTPDIVFPICVILWPQEEGLTEKKNSKTKRGQYISQIHTRTLSHTHMHLGSEKPVLVPCLKEAWKEAIVITKQHTGTCKWKRERAVLTAKLHSKQAKHLWEVQMADLEDSFGVMLGGLYTLKTKTSVCCDYSSQGFMNLQDVTVSAPGGL